MNRHHRLYADEDDEGYNYDDEEDYDEDDDGYGMHAKRSTAAAETSGCACCQLMGKNSRCGKAVINRVMLQPNCLAEADSVEVSTKQKKESFARRL